MTRLYVFVWVVASGAFWFLVGLGIGIRHERLALKAQRAEMLSRLPVYLQYAESAARLEGAEAERARAAAAERERHP